MNVRCVEVGSKGLLIAAIVPTIHVTLFALRVIVSNVLIVVSARSVPMDMSSQVMATVSSQLMLQLIVRSLIVAAPNVMLKAVQSALQAKFSIKRLTLVVIHLSRIIWDVPSMRVSVLPLVLSAKLDMF